MRGPPHPRRSRSRSPGRYTPGRYTDDRWEGSMSSGSRSPPPKRSRNPSGDIRHAQLRPRTLASAFELAWGCVHGLYHWPQRCMGMLAAAAAEPGWRVAIPCNDLLGRTQNLACELAGIVASLCSACCCKVPKVDRPKHARWQLALRECCTGGHPPEGVRPAMGPQHLREASQAPTTRAQAPSPPQTRPAAAAPGVPDPPPPGEQAYSVPCKPFRLFKP